MLRLNILKFIRSHILDVCCQKIRWWPLVSVFRYVPSTVNQEMFERTLFSLIFANSLPQRLANNTEIENLQNKSHAKISELTVSNMKTEY